MKRGWLVGVATLYGLLVVAVPRVCAAAPPVSARSDDAPDSATPPSRLERWYGWQTLTADGVAGALFLGAVADDHNTALFGFSGLTFAVGGPAIHVAHGRWGVALGSFGMRLLGPFVGAVIGAQADVKTSVDGGPSNDTHGKWGPVGGAIGGLLVSVIDGAFIAYDRPVSNPAQPRGQLLPATPMPQLLVLQHGVGIGYSGQF